MCPSRLASALIGVVYFYKFYFDNLHICLRWLLNCVQSRKFRGFRFWVSFEVFYLSELLTFHRPNSSGVSALVDGLFVVCIWRFWRKLQSGLINLRVLPTRTYIEYPYWFSLWSPYCFWIASLLCSLLSQNYPNLSDGLVCNCKQCSRKSCHCILVLSSCDEEGLIIFSSLLSDRFTFVAFSPQILCGKRYQYNGNIIKVSTVLNI